MCCFSFQEGCSDSRKDQLSLEVVTALCLAFKISISKAFDQVIETQHKVLMESIISLLNPCHEGTGADPPGAKNDLLFHASSFFYIPSTIWYLYFVSPFFEFLPGTRPRTKACTAGLEMEGSSTPEENRSA